MPKGNISKSKDGWLYQYLVTLPDGTTERKTVHATTLKDVLLAAQKINSTG